MEIETNATVGALVAEDYRTATVFQKYGIDFCCKGGKSINEVCQQKGLDLPGLLSELKAVSDQPGEVPIPFNSWPLDLLVDYIEKKHHRYVQASIPPLLQFLKKIYSVHGSRHPELLEILNEFSALAEELYLHMHKEEHILFPFIRRLVQMKQGTPTVLSAPFGTINNPIQMMEHEHESAGEKLSHLEQLSNHYQMPEDGCTTYRVAFELLKAFEQDLHQHIHLENNILFPGALRLEQALN